MVLSMDNPCYEFDGPWLREITGSESALLYLQTNLQSLETSLILKKFLYVVTILSNSATKIIVVTPEQPVKN